MQTGRQWMVSQDWMVKGNQQTEWIEKRGILLWLAFYTGGLGGGLYLVSLFFNNMWGMLIGWIIVAVIKGGLHFMFLGKPARFWRLFMHPQTSWLSRGLFFVVLFAGFGALQLLLQYFVPDQTALIMTLKVLAGIFALCVATYTGFVLNNVKGVPFWNLSLLPVLFVACGILGGFGMTVAIGTFDHNVNMGAAEMGSRIMLALNVIIIVLYLLIEARREGTGKEIGTAANQRQHFALLLVWRSSFGYCHPGRNCHLQHLLRRGHGRHPDSGHGLRNHWRRHAALLRAKIRHV